MPAEKIKFNVVIPVVMFVENGQPIDLTLLESDLNRDHYSFEKRIVTAVESQPFEGNIDINRIHVEETGQRAIRRKKNRIVEVVHHIEKAANE
jgi:hypothetical protein